MKQALQPSGKAESFTLPKTFIPAKNRVVIFDCADFLSAFFLGRAQQRLTLEFKPEH